MEEDLFIYGITVEYDGQQENVLGKFKIDTNAFLIAKFILNELQQRPIIRVINCKTKEVLGAYQKEIKVLEKTTKVFG